MINDSNVPNSNVSTGLALSLKGLAYRITVIYKLCVHRIRFGQISVRSSLDWENHEAVIAIVHSITHSVYAQILTIKIYCLFHVVMLCRSFCA